MCPSPAETPIEEFTPTPAFPALQYLESVDVEGVAWRAGLRTGDFLIEVTRDNRNCSKTAPAAQTRNDTNDDASNHVDVFSVYVRVCALPR